MGSSRPPGGLRQRADPGAGSGAPGQMLLLPVMCRGASSHVASKSKAAGKSLSTRQEQLIWRTCERPWREPASGGLAPSWRGDGAAARRGGQAAEPANQTPSKERAGGKGAASRDAALTLPRCSLRGPSLSVPATAPLLLPASSPGKGWGMMKAPCHSPILRGPKRALLPLKLLSKALKMKTNVVLICSFFYSVIKTAANLNQRHKIAGGKLCHAGKAEPGRSWRQLPRSASPREGGGPGRRVLAGPAVAAPAGTAWPLSRRSARGTGRAVPRAAQRPEPQREFPLSLEVPGKPRLDSVASRDGQAWLTCVRDGLTPSRERAAARCPAPWWAAGAWHGMLTPRPRFSSHGRQQGGRLRLRHLLGRSGLRHHAGVQPRGPEGLQLRPAQEGPLQGRARGVRLGRLQRQHQLRDPVCQSLRGRQGEESEGRPGADEPAQQPLREDGERSPRGRAERLARRPTGTSRRGTGSGSSSGIWAGYGQDPGCPRRAGPAADGGRMLPCLPSAPLDALPGDRPHRDGRTLLAFAPSTRPH